MALECQPESWDHLILLKKLRLTEPHCGGAMKGYEAVQRAVVDLVGVVAAWEEARGV